MLKTIVDGGWMMIPLMVESVIALGVVLDRAVSFWRLNQVDTRSLRAQVMQLIREDRVQEAALLCAQTPNPVSAVLLAGIQAFDKHRAIADKRDVAATVKTAMEEFAVHAISAVEKRFSVMVTIGNSAPLLGMTGTVVGMIMSFEQLAQGGGNAAKVAEGISVALITTAAGLLIAMLAVLPYNYFMSLSAQVDLEIEECKTQFIDFITTGI